MVVTKKSYNILKECTRIIIALTALENQKKFLFLYYVLFLIDSTDASKKSLNVFSSLYESHICHLGIVCRCPRKE